MLLPLPLKVSGPVIVVPAEDVIECVSELIAVADSGPVVSAPNAAPPPDVLRTSVFPVASDALNPLTFTITAPLLAFTRSTRATGCARAVGGVAVKPPPDAT